MILQHDLILQSFSESYQEKHDGRVVTEKIEGEELVVYADVCFNQPHLSWAEGKVVKITIQNICYLWVLSQA